MRKLLKRAAAPTPKFFKVLRGVGMSLAAFGGTVLAAPVLLPTILVSLGGYLTVAGGVLIAASQLSISDDDA